MIPSHSKILIVDDDPDIREVMRDRLKAMGFEVLEAADGAQALTRLRENSLTITLLDLMMPKKSGLDVLKAIRDDWPFLAAAIGVATKGTAVLLAADGTELAHLEITDDALDGGGGFDGRVVTTAATVVEETVVQGSAPADTGRPTTDSSSG